MPVEYHIVRCCDCLMFQVQQKKKVKRFNCKLCGKKQSLQRIYGQSYQAKDLRPLVQQFNMDEGTAREIQEERKEIIKRNTLEEEEDEELDGIFTGERRKSKKERVEEAQQNSVWNEFKYEDSESEGDSNEERDLDNVKLNFDAHSQFSGIKRKTISKRKKVPAAKKKVNGYSTKPTYSTKPKSTVVSTTSTPDGTRNNSVASAPPKIRESRLTNPIVVPVINTPPPKLQQALPVVTKETGPSMWDQFNYDNSSQSEEEEEY